jgi:DNA-binding NarL/FixJ family response regulator
MQRRPSARLSLRSQTVTKQSDHTVPVFSPDAGVSTPERHGPIRLIIADSHALFRGGLKAVLRLQPHIVVVAETDRADELLPLLAKTTCDVLLLDLQLDRSVLADIGDLAARTSVLIVTASERMEDVLAGIQSGAKGVVFKRFAVDTLVIAIEAVARGRTSLPANIQRHLSTTVGHSAAGWLTRSEREVIRHVSVGLRNTEIASKLFVSEVTIKTHLNNIFRKLGFRNRVELALYAVGNGLASPGYNSNSNAIVGQAAAVTCPFAEYGAQLPSPLLATPPHSARRGTR